MRKEYTVKQQGKMDEEIEKLKIQTCSRVLWEKGIASNPVLNISKRIRTIILLEKIKRNPNILIYSSSFIPVQVKLLIKQFSNKRVPQ